MSSEPEMRRRIHVMMEHTKIGEVHKRYNMGDLDGTRTSMRGSSEFFTNVLLRNLFLDELKGD